jgi:hypothetical protein
VTDKETEVYADVEELINPGYITETVVAAGVSVSFRSPYPSDFQIVRVRGSQCRTVRDWKVLHLSVGAWEVDGHIVHAQDTHLRRGMQDLFRAMANPVIDGLYSTIMGIRARYDAAAAVLEAYCYEDRSRSRWRMAGRACPSKAAPAWVAAAGPNYIQQLWLSYNLSEDDRLQWENDWFAATTITASMSSKWVKDVRTEEAARWRKEKERREQVIRKAQGTDVQDVMDQNGTTVMMLRTNEDLVEQMKRWERGEYDEHDTIVKAYKEGIRQRHAEAEAHHAERMEALERARDEALSEAPLLVGYTPEQLAEMGRDVPDTTRKVYDTSHPERLYDKYLSKEAAIGGLRPDGKGGEMEPARQPIADVVANRRVQMPNTGTGV